MSAPPARDLPLVTIVCPVYNEARAIRPFHARLSAALERLAGRVRFEILFVNNRSTDGTLEALRDLMRDDPRVQIVTLGRNFGYQAPNRKLARSDGPTPTGIRGATGGDAAANVALSQGPGYRRRKMIDGVVVSPRRILPDERGKVMHMLKATDPEFERFGEIYFSLVYPGVVKGWHRHRRMTLCYAVPVGQVKLVLYDDRPASPTRGAIEELFVGADNYCLVKVPPLVWNGFKGVGVLPALVNNCATVPHDPDEIERLDPQAGAIPYDWALKHR